MVGRWRALLANGSLCVRSLTNRDGLFPPICLLFRRGPADRAGRGALDSRPGSGRMSGGVDGDMWQRGRPLPPGRSGGMGPGMRGAAVANLPALHKTESAFKVWLVDCWHCLRFGVILPWYLLRRQCVMIANGDLGMLPSFPCNVCQWSTHISPVWSYVDLRLAACCEQGSGRCYGPPNDYHIGACLGTWLDSQQY